MEELSLRTLKVLLFGLPALSAAIEKSNAVQIHTALGARPAGIHFFKELSVMELEGGENENSW